MNENNKKEKDEFLIPEKLKNKKFNSSIISPKKVNNKNSIRNKKGVFQIQKRPNIISEGDKNSKNLKIEHASPEQKLKTSELYNLKSFQKNLSNNPNQIKIQKQKKFQKSNNSSTVNNHNMLEENDNKNKEENKKININKNKIIVNPKKLSPDDKNYNNKIEINNSSNASHSQKSKKIKINTLNNSKNNRNNKNEKKINKLIKNENYMDNFTVEECDEKLEKIYNSRKHYSLTNPNILPCISFSNPFTKQHKNNISNNNPININNQNAIDSKEKEKISKTTQNKTNVKEIPEKNILNEYNSNAFSSNNEKNMVENEEEDVKINISNLEIDIEQMNDEVSEDCNKKSEIPITNVHQQSKSFIQFNNNLSFKLAAEKSKNTPSYMLALCPKLFMGQNKKKMIKENYEVNDAISEEMESDTLTPKNSKNKITLEGKNTKNSTKEKNSERNKKPHEYESEDLSYEEDKKNIYNSNPERKNISIQKNNSGNIYNIYKGIFQQNKNQNKNLKENGDNIIVVNKENSGEEKTKSSNIKKREKIKKKLNTKEINIDTQNINNITNVSSNIDIKNSPIKANCFFTSPNKDNISFHHNNNTINNIVYIETENLKYNYNKIRSKILKIKNNEHKEKHQKAKSLISNINLSTLYLYDNFQSTNTNNNILINKKQKFFKSNLKSTDYRNKILNKEKNIEESENNKTLKKKKSNENYIFNSNNRTNSLKTNEEKVNYNNKKKLKKITFSHLLKSPKYKVNPFLSNLSSNNDKSNYNTNNNDNIFNMHSTENKYSNYYELFKKRNNNPKVLNTNNNTENTVNNEYSNNYFSEVNSTSHCKKISQQFIDEYNYLLETKNEKNNCENNNEKIKILKHINGNNEPINPNQNPNVNLNKKNSLNKYSSYNKKKKQTKVTFDVNNNSVKFKNNINTGNSSIKKISQITPCHKKSRTFFISPSYIIKNINNDINNAKKKNELEKIENSNSKETSILKDNKNNYSKTNNSKKNVIVNKSKNIHSKKNNTINKNNSKSKYTTKNSLENKDIKRNKSKFIEIKKIIGETSLTKIIHKKTNTIGNTNAFSNVLFNNFFAYNNLIKNNQNNNYNNINSNSISTRNNSSNITNKQLKKAASINNLLSDVGNRKKIVSAMQRMKFIPVSFYSKAIKELFKSSNHTFALLVYKDQNQRYIFRGLYEVCQKDPKIANKLFAPNNGQNNININNINFFYNYSIDRGEFFRYKFNNDKNKKFNEDTIILF